MSGADVAAAILGIASMVDATVSTSKSTTIMRALRPDDKLKTQQIILDIEKKTLEQWATRIAYRRATFSKEDELQIVSSIASICEAAERAQQKFDEYAAAEESKNSFIKVTTRLKYLRAGEQELQVVMSLIQALNRLLGTYAMQLPPTYTVQERTTAFDRPLQVSGHIMPDSGLERALLTHRIRSRNDLELESSAFRSTTLSVGNSTSMSSTPVTKVSLRELWETSMTAMIPMIHNSDEHQAMQLKHLESRLRIWGMDLFDGQVGLDSVVQEKIGTRPTLRKMLASPLIEIALTQGYMLDRWSTEQRYSSLITPEMIKTAALELRRVLLNTEWVHELIMDWADRSAQEGLCTHDEPGDLEYLKDAVELLYEMLPTIRTLKIERLLLLERSQFTNQDANAQNCVDETTGHTTRRLLDENYDLAVRTRDMIKEREAAEARDSKTVNVEGAAGWEKEILRLKELQTQYGSNFGAVVDEQIHKTQLALYADLKEFGKSFGDQTSKTIPGHRPAEGLTAAEEKSRLQQQIDMNGLRGLNAARQRLHDATTQCYGILEQ